MERMKPFKEKGVDVPVIRKYSADGRKDIQDDSLDFIYIDARHDYKAMMEDLEFMWPKLKEGGIFAGMHSCPYTFCTCSYLTLDTHYSQNTF